MHKVLYKLCFKYLRINLIKLILFIFKYSLPSLQHSLCLIGSNPTGHSLTPNSAGARSERGKSPGNISANGGSTFRHYGSSLSLSNGSDSAMVTAAELTTRTLRPPSPTTLRKSSVPGRQSFGPSAPPRHSKEKHSIPSLHTAELQSPKLADYLEKPRLVGAITTQRATPPRDYSHHAKVHYMQKSRYPFQFKPLVLMQLSNYLILLIF